MFDIDVDAAPNKSRSGRERSAGGAPNAKRQKKDSKFGYGGKKRFSKSGDAESAGDMRGFSAARMKGKGGGGAKKRPGKSRRVAGR
jgi:rRNA-processing protein EBP2